MTEFYRLPNWALTALVMALALCIVLQTLAISYSIRRLQLLFIYCQHPSSYNF